MVLTLSSLLEAARKAELDKIKVERVNSHEGVFHIHHYELYHPNLPRILKVYVTINEKNKNYGNVDIVGNHADYNKVGPSEIRALARQLKNELGITHIGGIRTGGSRGSLNDPLKSSTIIKISEEYLFETDDIFQTKDLNKLSTHLSQKHGAHVELYPHHQGSIYLSTLIVPKHLRGKGVASNALKDVIHYAKIHKVKVVLNAEPLDDETKEKRLIDFYKSHGFVENKGRNRDLTVGGSQQKNTMYTRTEI